MLGHWHRIEGEVMHGEKRGRDLGYPTANMSVDGLHLPRSGSTPSRPTSSTGPHRRQLPRRASSGVRPMFGENAPNLETFLFDFKGDLYGQHLSIALVDYLRPELKFDGLDALIAQMDADSARARAILAAPDRAPPPLLGNRPLNKLTAQEWEALCDGCGKCCLNKLEYEDTGEVAYHPHRLPPVRRDAPASAATTRTASCTCRNAWC
jgi:hypothetical protein